MQMKNRKRWVSILSFFLALVLGFSSTGLTALAADFSNFVDYSNSHKEGGGYYESPLITADNTETPKDAPDPSSDKPEPNIQEIDISTADELIQLAQTVNSGDNLKGTTIILQNNIALTSSWTPIGVNPASPFCGIFDGQNYTISGINVADDINGGLFGYLIDAEIYRLKLDIVSAPNSTDGLFMSAINSKIEDTSNNAVLGMSSLGSRVLNFGSTFAVADQWTGKSDYSWYTAGVSPLEIDTADKLSGFRDMVNDTTPAAGSPVNPSASIPLDFAGVTIILTADVDLMGKDWEPIGSTAADPFKGSFVGGYRTIQNLNAKGVNEAGLFAYTDSADIVNFTLEDPKATATGAAGKAATVVVDAIDTNVAYIDIIRPVVTGYDASGVVGWATWVDRISLIQQCLVYEPNISGTDRVSGIVGTMENYGVTKNTVYGGTIRKPVSTLPASNSGILTGPAGITYDQVGPNASYSNTSLNTVLGTHFDGPDALGIIGSVNAWDTVNNNFISDVSTTDESTFHLATNHLPIGVEMTLTDSALNVNYLGHDVLGNAADDLKFTLDNYWDDIAPKLSPVSGENGNMSYSTAYLTNGIWVPNSSHWVTDPNGGFYPEIEGLKNSNSAGIKRASAVGSISLRPEDILEKYTEGARELRIMRYTSEGEQITWTGYPSTVKVRSGGSGYDILYTENDEYVTPFTLTATVGAPGGLSFKKDFDKVTLIDNKLKEDISKRTPVDGDVVAIGTKFQRVFYDKIEADSQTPQKATLSAMRAGVYVPEQTIICDSTLDNRFALDPATKTATLDFILQEGQQYKIDMPYGMVMEAPNANGQVKKNFSELYTAYFTTASVGTPTIVLSKPLWSGSTAKPFTLKELLDSFVVYDSMGGAVMYDSTNTALLQEYTGQHGAWDNNDPIKSMENVLTNATGPVVYYYLNDSSVLGAGAKAGTARMYIMAKNDDQRVDRKIMDITVAGVPQWLGSGPEPFVHIPWTKNLDSLKTSAKQGASATIKKNDGTEVPCPIEVVVNQDEWEYSKTAKVPTAVSVDIYAIDQTGARSDTAVPVVVYLDRPLYWTMTPSPTVLSYTTKKGVEEQMNVIPRNFSSSILIYDHWFEDQYMAEKGHRWSGNYRTEGTYYVDLSSETELVTICEFDHKSCPHKGDHPNNRVSDDFIFDIIKTPGEDTNSFWGDVTKDFVSGEYLPGFAYSQGVSNLKPTSYMLPKHVIEALSKQNYGMVEMQFADTYRWKLYSDSINTAYKWGDAYSLEIHTVANDIVTDIVGGVSKGMQIQFEQKGRLFGDVAFEINLDKVGSVYKNMPKKDLGLYAYNTKTGKLDMISDVIVDSDNWASATLSQLLPTTYVLKEKAASDKVAAPIDDFTPFYITSKTKGPYGEWKQAADPVRVEERKSLDELQEIVLAEMSADLTGTGIGGPAIIEKSNRWIMITGIATVVIAGIGSVIYFIRKKEGK